MHLKFETTALRLGLSNLNLPVCRRTSEMVRWRRQDRRKPAGGDSEASKVLSRLDITVVVILYTTKALGGEMVAGSRTWD